MASRMDAVVVVARAEVTNRDALAHAVDRLKQIKARIVGGVLNQIDLEQRGYYSGYYYKYKRYYGEEDAEGPPEAARAAGGGERD